MSVEKNITKYQCAELRLGATTKIYMSSRWDLLKLY